MHKLIKGASVRTDRGGCQSCWHYQRGFNTCAINAEQDCQETTTAEVKSDDDASV